MIEMGVLPQVSAATAALMIMYELHTTSTGTSNSDLVPSSVLRVNASKTASPDAPLTGLLRALRVRLSLLMGKSNGIMRCAVVVVGGDLLLV